LDPTLEGIRRKFSGYDNLTETERRSILGNRAAADHPQPVDYGLTDVDLEIAEGRDASGITFGQSFTVFLAIWLPVYTGFWFFGDYWRQVGDARILLFFVCLFAFSFLAWTIFSVLLLPIAIMCIAGYKRRHPSAGLLAYQQALNIHHLYTVATYEAKQALLRQRRSYWDGLNGYEFERATAEVLTLHQFNPKVTKGSADGGIDIEVARGGRKGVVQCKAHVASVAPHTVRDLYGVMAHSQADFGIIVSRGGFTKGAIEFARNKPILLVDSSDLIAMQEGQDVLAEAFLVI
jgi:HJR/Mrr/RecB family endonuclease